MSSPAIAVIHTIVPTIASAGSLLFCLDFDGTLAPIVESPDLAVMLPALAETVRTLAAFPTVTVAIVSGRSVADLRQRFDEDIICAGCHGLEMEGPDFRYVHQGAAHLMPVVDQVAWDLEAAFLDVPGIFVERKGLSATVHYRQAPPHLEDWLRSTIDLIVAPYSGLVRLTRAHKAWEIRPCVEWNKGAAVRYLTRRSAPQEPFVICAGDDLTDEDMFSAVVNGISVCVGPQESTRASYRVASPAEFADFLQAVCLALCSRQSIDCALKCGTQSQ